MPSELSDVRIGVIGGSGVYDFFEADSGARELAVANPYGRPVTVTLGEVGGRRAAFVPRHGVDHSSPPHRIEARAMIWALAHVGVRALISTAAVGSLNPSFPVGSIALADQLVDRTHARADTYFDGDVVRHLSFADPFSLALRALALAAQPDLLPTATVLVIQGPRFSTRAESRMKRDAGIDLVNMTLYPEIALAAELGIDAIALCVVTDVDSGESAEDAVTAEAVFARLREVKPRLLSAIERIIAVIPDDFTARTLIDPDAVARVLDGGSRHP